MAIDDVSRHRSRYLGQMILRTLASLMSCAIFALAVYTVVKFNVSFKITFAVVSVPLTSARLENTTLTACAPGRRGTHLQHDPLRGLPGALLLPAGAGRPTHEAGERATHVPERHVPDHPVRRVGGPAGVRCD